MSIFESQPKCECNKPDCVECYNRRKNELYSEFDIPARKNDDVPDIREIIQKTSEAANVHVADIMSKCRKDEFKTPRQIACYIARVYAKKDYLSIGRSINNHHTTIIHSCKVVKNMLETKDKEYSDILSKTLRKLRISI